MKRLILTLAVLTVLFTVQTFGQAEEEMDQHMRTYQLGAKYNDRVIVKQSLYNMLAINPQNDSALYNLAAIYFDANQYASTILVGLDLLAVAPDNLVAHEMMAISYESLGLKDKALDHYERIYLKDGNNMNALYKVTFLQLDLKRLEECKTNVDILLGSEAINELKLVFSFDQKTQKEYQMRVSVLNLKGLLYKELGDLATAKTSFEEALALDPTFLLAQQNLDGLE